MRTALMIGGILLLAACNAAGAQEGKADSGEKGTRTFDAGAGFEKVSLVGAGDVIVTVGGAPSIRAEGDTARLEQLDVRVEDGELKIGLKKGKWSFGWGNGSNGPVTVHVTVPRLAGAWIGGAGDIRIDKVEGGDFNGTITGAGDISVGAMKVQRAAFSIQGSGGISAAGTADSSDIQVAGSGDMKLENLAARTAKISIMGSGDVRARASETADVSIMGSGDVTLAGNARCTINKHGSGSVRCERDA
ncbi:MAG TPA: head GIN domain-containing protein [Allosphingosinicella sp.]|jgi:hypothetical protein